MLDPSTISLSDKVAIVTGGGGGMGRSVAETYAAFGASVVVAERDPDRARETVAAIERRGGKALAQVIDVCEQAQVDAMTAATIAAFGRIDILVNNVGDFLGRGGSFARSSDEDWEALYDINLKQVFRCTRAALPHLKAHGQGGSIINVSTIEAFRGIPGAVVYAAFNAALTGFTKSLAVELGPRNIRVNAIAPETTDTLQLPVHRWIPEEHRDRIPYWIPLGRFGRPDDAAGCALFLASDLSSWVTGTTIHMDGGALAAGGFYRTPEGHWTNTPIVEGSGLRVG